MSTSLDIYVKEEPYVTGFYLKNNSDQFSVVNYLQVSTDNKRKGIFLIPQKLEIFMLIFTFFIQME